MNLSLTRRTIALLLLLHAVAGTKLRGATINSTWSGGAAGNWSVPGNWSPIGVPNNATDLYNVTIPSPSAVMVDGTFTIQIFDVDSGALANMPAGFLTLDANGILDGTLRMGSDGSFATARLALGEGVTVSGAGTIELLGNTSLEGPVNEVIIGSGITVQTGTWPSGGPTIMANLTIAGPLNINNPNFFVQAGRMLTSTGPLHLSAGAKLTSLSATVALRNNTTQLDTASEINGGITLDGATVNGPGKLRPNQLNLLGTNTINAPIMTDLTTIVAHGSTALNGSGSLLVQSTTPLNAAAPGATLTTGPGFAINIASNLNINLPTRLQGQTTASSGLVTLGSNLENDGAIQLNGTSIFRVNANANVIAGSTGTMNIGPSARLEVTGPSTLNGTYSVSNDFVFKSGITTVAGTWNGDSTSEIILESGATANFSQQVGNAGTLTVGGTNRTLAFNGGLLNFGSANVTGSTAVFGVTGNTTATGFFRVGNGATHRGAGTTTAQSDVEYSGKLDGRTLVTKGAATAFQITLQNNALFENRGTLSLFNFGTPDTVTGIGVFRNTATLLQSDLFGPTTNNIDATFEQTGTGTTAVTGNLALRGDNAIAGNVSIPFGTKFTLGALATNTTSSVTGALTGGGTFEVAGNTVTGAAPSVTVTGSLDLGASSTTIVRNGANLTVDTPAAPGLGTELQVDRARLKIGGAAPLPLDRVFLTRGFLDGPDQGPRVPVQVIDIDADGIDTDGCRIRKVDLQIQHEFSTTGRVDLEDAGLTIGSGGSGVIAGPTSADSCTIEIFIDGEFHSTAAITVTNSSVTAHGGNGATPPGGVTLDGPATVLNSTITAAPGSNGGAGGSITISNIEEMRNTTVVAERDAQVNITLPSVPINRERVLQDKINAKMGTVTLADYFFPASLSRLDGTGCFEIKKLLSNGSSAGIAPGQSAGRLQLTGAFPLASGSEITIELGGTTQTTEYDLLAVTGVLTTTNTSLRPRFINNFQNSITPANTFIVIETTQPIVGSFFNVFGGRVMAADRSGTFSVALTNGNTRVVLGDFQPGTVIDSDNDGMSDEFENEFFGNPTAGEPNADDDGDGMTNLEEYHAGTSPVDANSVLRIDEIRRENNDIVIVFKTVADRAYRLEAGPHPTGPFPLTIANIPAAPSNGMQTITDTGAAINAPRYYRLVLLP